jgi:HlyD family secretion protein
MRSCRRSQSPPRADQLAGAHAAGGTSGAYVYETADLTYGPIRKFVTTSGPVRALVTVSVGSQLSGQINELKADFNTEVKAGDELAVIDDKSFVAKVAQSRADLTAATAMLANQDAALLKAEAIERNAERLMGRQQTLASKGIAATATLDNATRDAEVARADVAVAKAQLENAKAVITQRQAQPQLDLERTRIRSPIDGTVIARTVDVATAAASLQAPELFKIAQDLPHPHRGAGERGRWRVTKATRRIPRRAYRAALPGPVAQVRLGGTELNNVVTYTVMIEAANDNRILLPGMTQRPHRSAKVDRALRLLDALRFKLRGAALPASSRNLVQQQLDRELERVKSELALTPSRRHGSPPSEGASAEQEKQTAPARRWRRARRGLRSMARRVRGHATPHASRGQRSDGCAAVRVRHGRRGARRPRRRADMT